MILKLKFCCFRHDSRTAQQSASKKNSAPHVKLRDSSQAVPGKSLRLISRFTLLSSSSACNALFSGSPVSAILMEFMFSSEVIIEPICRKITVFRCSVKMWSMLLW